MSETRPIQGTVSRPPDQIRYPTDHVVGIVDTPAQAKGALEALTTTAGCFYGSELKVLCGEQAAERLHASTGRTGLLDLVLRVAERIGMPHEEFEVKERYEQALRGGHFVLAVLAPTEERKGRAAQILRDHGGHFINFFGRFTIETIAL